jgi:hypothetical protein
LQGLCAFRRARGQGITIFINNGAPRPALFGCLVPQRFKLPRHGAKCPHLLAWSRPWGADQKARNDRLLMHVETTTPLDDHLHHRLLPSEGDCDAAATFETHPMRAPRSPGQQRMAPLCSAGRTPNRGRQPPELCQPHTVAHREGSDQLARAASIFIHTSAPQAPVACHEIGPGAFALGRLNIGFEGDPIAEAFEGDV